MSFVFYDLTFLVIFVLAVSIFLYKGKKNLKKEGLLLLYRTKLGMKLIDYVGGKYQKTLMFFSYVSIVVGYILMIGILYLLGRIAYTYMFFPEVVRAIKVPPIMPLIPYLPEVFKIDFLPPFYFAYWIIIIAIIAIPHEFAHGIFMKRFNVKIKSTGFGFFPWFFPVFLAAFVEQDETDMEKKGRFEQMAILSAGTFANILTALFFLVVLILFFTTCFSAAGIQFDTYSMSVVAISNITSVGGIPLENSDYEKILNGVEENLTKIETSEKSFLADKTMIQGQEGSRLIEEGYLFLYDDAPAINSNLEGTITKVNGVEVLSLEEFSNELMKFSPGEEIVLTVKTSESFEDREIVLGENPEDNTRPWLGVGFYSNKQSGLMASVYESLSGFREDNVYYESKLDSELTTFILDLLWWIILISLTVALINMVPVGIFDGGRFFYLTVLALTKSENKAKKAFSFMTYLFLLFIVVLMFFYFISFF